MRVFWIVLALIALAGVGLVVAADTDLSILQWRAPARCRPGVMALERKDGLEIYLPIIVCEAGV